MNNTGGFHFIEQTMRKDGGILICEWFNTPLINYNNQAIGAISLIQDITLEMENERLKSEFVSIVSHELRTPVTSIKGSLGLLASGVLKDDQEKSAEMLSIAIKNTDRLQLLINDILDVEKLDSGKIEYTIRKTRCATSQKTAKPWGSIPCAFSSWAIRREVRSRSCCCSHLLKVCPALRNSRVLPTGSWRGFPGMGRVTSKKPICSTTTTAPISAIASAPGFFARTPTRKRNWPAIGK
jgi:hypothetical protein